MNDSIINIDSTKIKEKNMSSNEDKPKELQDKPKSYPREIRLIIS